MTKGGGVVLWACQRDYQRPRCAQPSCNDAAYVECEYKLRGRKAGQVCGKKLCERHACEHHDDTLCPGHYDIVRKGQ